jgi:DNA-directed RNA polymerase specialized sigma54-like protein
MVKVMGKSIRRVKEPEFNYLSKRAVLTKLKRSTRSIQGEGLLKYLRKNGFLEVSLEEVHDRLSKIRRSLSQLILLERNGGGG